MLITLNCLKHPYHFHTHNKNREIPGKALSHCERLNVFLQIMIRGDCLFFGGGRRGRDRIIVGFTTACAISASHH